MQAAQINIPGFLCRTFRRTSESRNRVRQLAPRFLEFHLHGTEETFHIDLCNLQTTLLDGI